jgi:hypothetical protein
MNSEEEEVTPRQTPSSQLGKQSNPFFNYNPEKEPIKVMSIVDSPS